MADLHVEFLYSECGKELWAQAARWPTHPGISYCRGSVSLDFFGAFRIECIVGLSMDTLNTSFKSYRRTALSRTDVGTRGAGLQVFGSRIRHL